MASIPPFNPPQDVSVAVTRGTRPAAAVAAADAVSNSATSTSQAASERAVAKSGAQGATAKTPAPAAVTAAVEAAPEAAQITPEALQKQFDRLLAPTQTALQFRVDEDADKLVVSVVEQSSGEVLLQIPSEVAIRIAKSLAADGRGLLSVNA